MNYQDFIFKISYPLQNRRTFVDGIITTLRDSKLNGVEVILIAENGTPLSRRLRCLLAILLHDLRQDVHRFGGTLDLHVEYDPRDFNVDSNIFNDLTVLSQADRIVINPKLSAEPWDGVNIDHPNVLKESVKFFVNMGLPPHKIIVGLLKYALRCDTRTRTKRLVSLTEPCFYEGVSYDHEFQKSTGPNGLVTQSDGNVTFAFGNEKSVEEAIQSYTKEGVNGFVVQIGPRTGYKECYANKWAFWTLRTTYAIMLDRAGGNASKLSTTELSSALKLSN